MNTGIFVSLVTLIQGSCPHSVLGFASDKFLVRLFVDSHFLHVWIGGKNFKSIGLRNLFCYPLFLNAEGAFLLDFMPKGATFNADEYCETPARLRMTLQNKWRACCLRVWCSFTTMLVTRGSEDITSALIVHTGGSEPTSLLSRLGYEWLPPDRKKKSFKGGHRYASDNDLKEDVKVWLKGLAAEV